MSHFTKVFILKTCSYLYDRYRMMFFLLITAVLDIPINNIQDS